MNDLFKAIQAVVYETCAYRDSDMCPILPENPGCQECYRRINGILEDVAFAIEGINIEATIDKSLFRYVYEKGAKDEHAYVVEYVRGLKEELKNGDD